MKINVTCQALDENGKRCKSHKPARPVNYHGEHVLYCNGPEPRWVRVYLCPKHRRKEP